MINLLENIEITDDDVSVGSIEDLIKEKEDCIICFEKIAHDDFIPSSHGLIKHNQGYHRKCWNTYIIKFDTCPLCRMNLIIHDKQSDDEVNSPFTIPPIDTHNMNNPMNIFYINIEALIFISTLGHTISVKLNDDLFYNILKMCASFYVAGVSFKHYMRQIACNSFQYMFLYYMVYVLTYSFLNKYSNIMIELMNEEY